MTWKDLPIWLKGGIIGLLFGIIDLAITLAFPPLYCKLGANCPPQPFIGKIATLFIMPLESILDISNNMVFQLILILLYFFIIGAIIGFIVGKIKSKKQ